MSPRIRAIEAVMEQNERRRFRVTVLFGVAIAALVVAVAYVLWSDNQQTSRLRSVSACYVSPHSEECRRGHANSVSLTTPEEACFILAQGGLRCRAPLPSAGRHRDRLLGPASLNYDATPGGHKTTRASSSD